MKKNKKVKKAAVKQSKVKPLVVSGNLNLIPPPEAHSITRSFSFKKNLGNYESADFFCSESGYAKPGEEEKVSEALYNFCKREVAKSVARFVASKKPLDVKSKDVSQDSAESDVEALLNNEE